MTQSSDKLFEEVLADGRTKVERARRRGERDAQAIRKKAAQDAQAMAERILADAGTEADLKRRQILATLEIEAQRERLGRCEDGLKRVYESVQARLASLEDHEMRQARLRLAVDAVAQMPDDDVLVALPPDLHDAEAQQVVDELASRVAGQLGRTVTARPADRPAEVTDGLVVRSADGRREIVNSLQERLRRQWPALRIAAAARLFPEVPQRKER